MSDTTYGRGRLIGHAGGSLNGHKYTNSKEALETNRDHACLLEFDVCRASDGLIIAHDGLEKKYGFSNYFENYSISDFQESLYMKKYTPMTVRDLLLFLQDTSVSVILDIKSNDHAEYEKTIDEISCFCDEFAVHDQVIVQVYNSGDFGILCRSKLDNYILALWKNFHNVRSEKCTRCLDFCFPEGYQGFQAISLRHIHVWDELNPIGDDLSEFLFSKTPMVFIHGQEEAVERATLERGFGLFTHQPEALKDHAARACSGAGKS